MTIFPPRTSVLEFWFAKRGSRDQRPAILGILKSTTIEGNSAENGNEAIPFPGNPDHKKALLLLEFEMFASVS